MKHETGICYNCGADQGLHHYETMQCPRYGIEETRFDKLADKFYPQQWTSTTFEDGGLRKLHDAASELLEACQAAIRIKDLWLYNEENTLPEYESEAQAVSKLESIFNKAIKNAI